MKKYLILSLLILASCAKNPANNNYDFVILGNQQEFELGREYRKGVSNFKIYKDASKQKYFNNLAQEVYNVGERQKHDVTVYFMKDDSVNASAIPGYIFINRGLMPYMQDEAAVVGVLGHESAHINARHMVREQSNNFLMRWVMNSLTGIFSRINKQQVSEISNKAYSRKYEYEADELSIKYLNKLDIPVANSMQFHKSMQMREKLNLKMANLNESLKKEIKAESEFSRTHPLSAKRAEFIEEKSNQWFELLEPYKQKEFYQQINGLEYGYSGTNQKDNIVVMTNEGIEVLENPKSGVYGFKNIAYLKKQKLKMVMPKNYQARIMSSDPLGFNYNKMIRVDSYQVSDDKNIYAIDIVADILKLSSSEKKKFIKKAKSKRNIEIDSDFYDEKLQLKDQEQLFSFTKSPSFIKKLLGQDSNYYYIYVKQLDDASNADYFNHFQVITLSTKIKKSFDETMLNDILFIKDNLVELTKKQASSIKPLTIKVKQANKSTTIEKLSSENIPYIHFNQEWFRIFNGLYDTYNTEIEQGRWLKLIPNPNKAL